jgi:hypothetical protein
MAHTFNTSSLVSMATKQALHSDSMLVNTVDKSYSKDFTQKKYTSGQTVTIEIEPQATITSGRVGVLQDRKPKTVTATLGQYNGVFETSSIQKAYDQNGEAGIVKFGRTIGLRLVREIERTGFSAAGQYFDNAVGTPGTEPGSLRTWATARARLDDQLAQGRIYGAMTPLAMVALSDSLKHATNPGTAISKQFVSGEVKHAAGIDFYQSNSTFRHTAGTVDNTTPLVDGTPANGATTLHIDGTTNAEVANISTKFTVGAVGAADAVYAIDPETKVNLPYLYKFSVTATSAASSGSGDVDLTVNAMFDSTDSRQNMSQLPQDGAEITWDTVDSELAQQNIVYAPDALSLISVPLASDSSGGLKETHDNYEGLQIRTAIHPRDAINDTETLRVDACWAWACPRPQHGCVVWGA